MSKKTRFKTYFKSIVSNGCFEVLLPREIHRALQELQDTTVDILAVVAAMGASDHTPYYPDEIWEVALMDDRYASKLVFDAH
jgi:hypothetical protein